MLWQILLWVGIVSANFVLDDQNGIVCSMIKKGGKSASILLEFTKIEPGEGDVQNSRFPTFILYYPDLGHVTRIPNRYQYPEVYKDKEKVQEYLTDGDNRFDVKIDKGFEPDIFNNVIVPGLKTRSGVDLRFSVAKSGLYCVYIAPSPIIKSFSIDVRFNNSHGLLSYHRYTNVYFELILFVFALVLYKYITMVIFKRDGKFQDRASLVTLFVMFAILVPTVVITFASLIIDLIMNAVSLNELHFQILLEVRYFLAAVFGIGLKAAILLLAMGHGSVYSPSNLMPSKLKNYTAYLFLVNLIVNLLGFVVNPSLAHDSVFRSFDTKNFDDSTNLGVFLEYASLMFPYIWFLSILYFYFSTSNKFKGEDRSQIRKSQIYQAFKKSISFFTLAPFVGEFIDLFIYWYRTFSLYDYQIVPIEDSAGDGLSIVYSLMAQAIDLSFDWSSLFHVINYITTLLLIYFIWIKNNIGLDDEGYNKIASAISREEDFTQDSIHLNYLQT